MKKLLSSFFVLLVFSFRLMAQDRTITGTVTDQADASPLPGVSIKIKGTTSGTVTNADGRFTIAVPSGSTLQFTYIGYVTKEIAVTSSNSMNVSLVTDSKQLGEVVVTALGIERNKNQLPYAQQQVSGTEVSKTRNSNFVNGLSGKVSGLEIRQNNTLGGSTNVVLRGNKSFTQSNQALFVIDGVPIDNNNTNTVDQMRGAAGYDYGNAAADVNPDDIASISVLKGAAASALYGSRAANGVIVITTKKGTKSLGITINSGLTIGNIDKSTFPKYQKEYGGGYGAYYESPDGYFLYRDINGDGAEDLVTPLSEDASYGGKFNPNQMVYQWDAFDPTSANYGKATPWVAAKNDPTSYFEDPVSYNENILLSGGGDKATFKFGYTRSGDKGILPNSKINKDLANLAASFNITSKLTANAAINYSRIKGLGRYGTGYDVNNFATNAREWWQTNVDIKEQKDAYFRTLQNNTWNRTDPSDLSTIYWDNPYFVRYQSYEDDERNRYIGNFNVNWVATKWLTALGRVALDTYQENQQERIAVGDVNVPQYARFDNGFREINFDLLLNFNANISDNINFKGLLGSNIRRTRFNSTRAATVGGLIVPGIYSLGNSVSSVYPVERLTEIEVDGIFAGATFTYKDFVTLDLTGRRDQSSTLPKDNNTYYYPSAAVSFLFSKLIPDSKWLTNGKFRLNYAEVGNSAPALTTADTYDNINTNLDPNPLFGSTPIFSVAGTKNNPELKPEKTKTYEIGLEMGFLQDRLGFDATYYNARSVDQIVAAPVSRSTGYSFKYINSGEVKNKGFELSLYGTPVKVKDFSWNINLNFSRNVSEVTELFEGADNLVLQSYQGGVTVNATLGQPYGTIRGSNFVYDNQGRKIIGANGYYQQSATSNEVIGNVNPDWIGGVNNAFKYRDFNLSFLIDVRHGGDIFSLDQYYGLATGLYPSTAGLNDLGNPQRNTLADGGGVVLPGVLADGSTNAKRVSATNYGLYGYVRNPAAAFIYDASFVKLREVALTYSLPAKVIAKLGPVKGVDLSLIGRNLWIIHKNLPYADPEDGVSSGNAQGYQVGSYPTTRTYGFNARFRF
ncbi:SusC/RagA family TonB-linked outer membrane protein [Pedobacter sp. HMF7647]|uniref:SusC/RagA family TonB-linked outer membrane protein n=1 Tax=Hufsiella arboris TaxID=2695275 RepID=A0A7K1Y5L2_9SPHI|nr:SusC/RagA family TonB-linked outer membrane protein [Hufsiella arboris]MXV49873.1 SusC/RagA family TonB-linked outer membrane protein [Hufsiella arboris]